MARCVDARRATILGDAVKQHLDAPASGIVSSRIGGILPGRHGATTMTPPMLLTVIEARLAVCRLEPADRIPAWIDRAGDFVSITRTADELSIVCDTDVVPRGVPMEGPWRAFKVQGPIVMTLIGVVAALANHSRMPASRSSPSRRTTPTTSLCMSRTSMPRSMP